MSAAARATVLPSASSAPSAPAAGLRVAVVSDATAERNGVASYYADLVAELKGRGADARLFCPSGATRRWHRYVAPPLPGDSTQRIWFPNPIRLFRAIRAFAPTAIIVPTPGPYGLYGLLLSRLFKARLVIGFHTHYEALAGIYWSDRFGRLCKWYLESCNRLLFRYADEVLANSPEMVTQAEQLGAREARLMGTSVAAEFIETPQSSLELPPRRLLFVGRLAEEKNIDQVIATAEEHPQIAVSIAGDGPLRPMVEAAATRLSNLRYLGWVAREDLVATVDQHDALILPSKVESFGTVALEAMARGRIVLVSNDCGIADWSDLARGLYRMQPGEAAPAAVAREFARPESELAATASAARRAAVELNEWNVATWITRLAPDDLTRRQAEPHP